MDAFCRILADGARDGLRAPAARAGHPGRLRPAPPEARGRRRARRRPDAPRLAAAPGPRGRRSLLVARAAVLLLPASGAAPLERAEIYFLDGARGPWWRRGDWLVPRYRGEPFFDKPPLTYWLMAASFRAFGFTPGAARLVPALAALGVLLATALARAACSSTGAPRSVGGAGARDHAAFLGFGRVAMSDMLLTLWSHAGRGPRRWRSDADGRRPPAAVWPRWAPPSASAS